MSAVADWSFFIAQLACGYPIGWCAALAADEHVNPSRRFDGLVASLGATAMWVVLAILVGERVG